MASFDLNFSDDFLSQLLASDFEQIATEALAAAAPELEDSVERSLDSVTNKGYSTGTTAHSIKATKPKKTKTDAFIVVARPTGSDKKGVRNMEKAAYLEYGTSKQAATPWLQNATNNAEASVLSKCQEIYNKAVGAR